MVRRADSAEGGAFPLLLPEGARLQRRRSGLTEWHCFPAGRSMHCRTGRTSSPSGNQCRTGNWSPVRRKRLPVPVPAFGRHYSPQSRASPCLRPGLQSPVPALGRRTGGQSQSPAALCVPWLLTAYRRPRRPLHLCKLGRDRRYRSMQPSIGEAPPIM